MNSNRNSKCISLSGTTKELNSVNYNNKEPTNLNNSTVNVSEELVEAAGFNVKTPVVSALIGNIKGILPTKKSEITGITKCDVCNCEVSSDQMLGYHRKGSKHKKRLIALEIIEKLKAAELEGITIGDDDDPNAFRCEICYLTVNSAQQLEFHLSGVKHKKNAGKLSPSDGTKIEPNNVVLINNVSEKIPPPPSKKKKKDEPQLIPCDICNVIMNSQIQYAQHLSSKKHMLKAQPPNPYKKKYYHQDKKRKVY